MEFPALVFKDNGPHQRAGGTYSHKLVEDADEHADALADGWFATLPEAIEGKSKPAPAKSKPAPAKSRADEAKALEEAAAEALKNAGA